MQRLVGRGIGLGVGDWLCMSDPADSGAEQTGIPRILEALESAEWERNDDGGDLEDLLGLGEGDEEADEEAEELGPEAREPILGLDRDGLAFGGNAGGAEDDGDFDVDKIQQMMVHLQATRGVFDCILRRDAC